MLYSDGEAAALAEIAELKTPSESWLDRVTDVADAPLDKAAGVIFDNVVGEKTEELVVKVTRVLNDAALWSVRREAVLEDYRSAGLDIDELSDIADLKLEEIRDTIKRLDLKYRVLGGVEGALAGFVGALGMAADIPALVALSLRAINEYATYFGFDISLPHERYYALCVLSAAAAATEESRQAALSQITAVAIELRPNGDRTVAPAEALLEQLADALVVRFAKGKLGQAVPVVGSAIGGGYNASFVRELCHVAELLYAERWLIAKHGPGVAIPTPEATP
jgi:hypothetical protein